MPAHQIYNQLSQDEWWSCQSPKMRWLAARYYGGVESKEQLFSHGEPQPIHRGHYHPPMLTADEIEVILALKDDGCLRLTIE